MIVAQELIDHILDFLHQDFDTLKQCSLVSKSFLPTSQRHIFSTLQITDSNVKKLEEFFHRPESFDLRDRVSDLLNEYTTELTLFYSERTESIITNLCLPEFKNLRKIAFEGNKHGTDIPEFLEETWMSPDSRIRTFSLDSGWTEQVDVAEWLYILPTTVENVSFIDRRPGYSNASPRFFRLEDHLPYAYPGRPARHVNGTLKLHLNPVFPLQVMLGIENVLKFNLTHISYRSYHPGGLSPLALLVAECKDTLESLDIICLVVRFTFYIRNEKTIQSFDLSRIHTLKRVRIWTQADFSTEWLCPLISTIPRPSNTTPKDPPLRFELHVSLPGWVLNPSLERDVYKPQGYEVEREVEKIVNPWKPVDAQLFQVISPGVSSIPGSTTAGITWDVSVPNVFTGPGKRIAASMFPLLSGATSLPRLV